jgi:DNA-binding transcriptional MerR regulator
MDGAADLNFISIIFIRNVDAQTPARRSRRVVLVSRSAFCAMCGISERQLALWEQEDLLAPVRIEQSGSAEPLYDRSALRRARVIRTLDEELEVNLPGIGVILNLLDRLQR